MLQYQHQICMECQPQCVEYNLKILLQRLPFPADLITNLPSFDREVQVPVDGENALYTGNRELQLC